MAAMIRRSVTSLVRTWPSTIIRRAAAKSIIGGFHFGRVNGVLYIAFSREGQPRRARKREAAVLRVPRFGLRRRARIVSYPAARGHVAEWLRNGLQNRVPRFNSGRGLQLPAISPTNNCACCGRHGARAAFRAAPRARFEKIKQDCAMQRSIAAMR